MDPNKETQPATTPEPVLIEAPEGNLPDVNPDALAALEASLAGESAPAAGTDDDATVNEPDATATTEPSATTEAAPAAPAATAEPAAAKPDDGAPKRPSDEFGELPADAPAKTRERFETLRTRYDEVIAERDQATQTAQQWQETIASTGATPEQFGSSLQYLSLVNSGSPESLQQAYDLLSGELANLGKLIGREVPGAYDPLADHPDLQQRVEDRMIDREDALEIAQARQQRALSQASSQRTTQATSDQADLQAHLNEVQAFGAQMRASDPLANAKLQAIAPLVKRVVGNLPRSEWVGAIRDAYAAAVVAPPTPAAEPAPSVPTTLRNTSTPGTGATKTPGSALEAMEMALSQR